MVKINRWILFGAGFLLGILVLLWFPYQNILQIYVAYGLFLIFAGILGLKLLYSINVTPVEEHSKKHPSLKSGIIQLSTRLRQI